MFEKGMLLSDFFKNSEKHVEDLRAHQEHCLKKAAYMQVGESFVSNSSFTYFEGSTVTEGKTYTIIELTTRSSLQLILGGKAKVLHVVFDDQGNKIGITKAHLKQLTGKNIK